MDPASAESLRVLRTLDRGDGMLESGDLRLVLDTVGMSQMDTELVLQALGKPMEEDSSWKIAIEDFYSWVSGKGTKDPQSANGTVSHEKDAPPGHKLRGVSVYHVAKTLMESVLAAGQDHNAQIYAIEPTVIRPRGAHTVCPRDSRMGAAYVDAVYGRDHAGHASFMLSYTWGYTIGDIADTLSQHCVEKSVEVKKMFVWMCCLCINQHRVTEAKAAGQVITFETFEAEFSSRVCGIGSIVAMMAPWHGPFYLKRVWCNFEMFTAVSKSDEVAMTIIMPPREMEDFRHALLEKAGIDRVWRACAGVRVEDAQASIPEDRDRILEMIGKGPGYQKLNSVIVERLQAWMVDCSEGYLRQNLATDTMETDIKLKLCTTVNKMLRSIGEQFRADSILQEALQIHERASTIESTEGADLLRQIGILRRREHDYEKAAEIFAQAQRIHEQTATLETDKGALLLLNMGLVHSEQGEYSTALPLYQHAMDIAVKANLVRTNIGSLIFRERACVKEGQGDLQGARADYAEALKVLRDNDSLATPAAAKLFAYLGRLMQQSKDLDGALSNFAEAKRIREMTNTMKSEDSAVMLRCYGDVLRSSGDFDAATEVYAKAHRVLEELGLLNSAEGKLFRQGSKQLEDERNHFYVSRTLSFEPELP